MLLSIQEAGITWWATRWLYHHHRCRATCRERQAGAPVLLIAVLVQEAPGELLHLLACCKHSG